MEEIVNPEYERFKARSVKFYKVLMGEEVTEILKSKEYHAAREVQFPIHLRGEKWYPEGNWCLSYVLGILRERYPERTDLVESI